MTNQILNPKSQKLNKLLPRLKENILLKNYTSFKIGGPARYFFIAKTKKDLIKAVKVAKELNLPFFILGGGSNLLVSDDGYNGLAVKIQNTKYKVLNTKLYTEAGTLLNQLIVAALENCLTGLEWAAGIPRITVGGAIRGNAGAFGTSMADIIKTVTVLEIPNSNDQIPNKSQVQNSKFQIKIFKNYNCQFSYRDSIFKHNENLIILSAEIELKKENKKEIQKKLKEYLRQRTESQPLGIPCAGSIFKNPASHHFSAKSGEGSVGELIEKCDLKGKKIGDVQISKKHANFIVNLGQGKAKDVLGLIRLAKEKVREKFGIELEEEIEYLS